MPDQPPRSVGPLRVLVVDSDDRVRESLAGLLAIGKQVIVVGSAGQATTALDLALEAHPDVVIVDPRLPEVDGGIAFVTRLRQLAPDIRIVAMSWSEGPDDSAFRYGADGFVRKTYRPTELVAAIVAATAGDPIQATRRACP